MSAAAIALGTDGWNAEAYGAASSAFGVSLSLKGYFGQIALAGKLWSLDKKLKDLLERFYKAAGSSADSSPAPTRERIESAIETLRSICGKIDEVYSIAKARGLTNWTLIGTALNSIRVRGSELLEIADAAELSLHPETFEPAFDKALEEYRRGATFDLASIK
jgi:hypothetical protein